MGRRRAMEARRREVRKSSARQGDRVTSTGSAYLDVTSRSGVKLPPSPRKILSRSEASSNAKQTQNQQQGKERLSKEGSKKECRMPGARREGQKEEGRDAGT